MYRVIKIQNMEIFNPEYKNGNLVKQEDDDFCVDRYIHFSSVVDSSGKPVKIVNLYLMSLLNNIKIPSRKTIYNNALHLSSFYNWCEKEKLNPLIMHKRKLKRPTYAYRVHLQELLNQGINRSSTCGVKMGVVVGLYKWLIYERKYKFTNKPFLEKHIYINHPNEFGLIQKIKVHSTDLAFKKNRVTPHHNGYILDGQKLHPLKYTEQIAVIDALESLGNIEMILIFKFAIKTGARISTICTLRTSCFDKEFNSHCEKIPIRIGDSSFVNNKNDKDMFIYVPRDLYYEIKTYIKSPKWKFRSKLSNLIVSKENRYVFLTRFGKPYYASKQDKNLGNYTDIPEAQSIRSFIKKQLKKKLIENGHDFKFRFHDLRATFGLNLLLSSYPKFNNNPEAILLALKIVQERLGHSSISSTERYLDFRSNLIYSGEVTKYINEK